MIPVLSDTDTSTRLIGTTSWTVPVDCGEKGSLLWVPTRSGRSSHQMITSYLEQPLVYEPCFSLLVFLCNFETSKHLLEYEWSRVCMKVWNNSTQINRSEWSHQIFFEASEISLRTTYVLFWRHQSGSWIKNSSPGRRKPQTTTIFTYGISVATTSSNNQITHTIPYAIKNGEEQSTDKESKTR